MPPPTLNSEEPECSCGFLVSQCCSVECGSRADVGDMGPLG